MNIFDYIIIYFSLILGFLSRFLGYGAGTAITGYFIRNTYPQIITKLSKKFDNIILVTGTNGKTSTTAIIAHIYKSYGVGVTTNSEGANLLRGVISTLFTDYYTKNNNKILVLEIEEASLKEVTDLLSPNVIIVTNIFRDQLDAYGEISRVGKLIKDGISNSKAKVLFNNDDPFLSELLTDLNNKVGYSLGKYKDNIKYENDLVQKTYYDPEILVENIEITQISSINIKYKNRSISYTTNYKEHYNILNTLAAVSYFIINDFDTNILDESIISFKNVFGRSEIIELFGSKIKLHLVKNPAGLSETLKNLENNFAENFIFILNDNVQDGKDVSWIWDANFDKYLDNYQNIYTSGIRALDISLRIKIGNYKSIPIDNISNLVPHMIDNQGDYVVLATYTAMNQFRKELKKYIVIENYKN